MRIELGNPNHYEKFHYPAGEMQVRLRNPRVFNSDDVVLARIHTHEDLVETALLGDATGGNATLLVPYLPYGRADRKFTPGDTFGLRFFATTMIQHFSSIATFDIHNKQSLRKFPWIENVGVEAAIQQAAVDFARKWQYDTNIHKINLLFPDEGAATRYNLPETFGSNVETVTFIKSYATKVRDLRNGALSGFEVPYLDIRYPILIVDDICDGGGTFLGISKAISEQGHLKARGLFVTHGIFSKGFSDLKFHFDEIYTTDTIKLHPAVNRLLGPDPEHVTILPIMKGYVPNDLI